MVLRCRFIFPKPLNDSRPHSLYRQYPWALGINPATRACPFNSTAVPEIHALDILKLFKPLVVTSNTPHGLNLPLPVIWPLEDHAVTFCRTLCKVHYLSQSR